LTATQTAEYIRILNLIFGTAPELKDFTIGFGCVESPMPAFKRTTNTFFRWMAKDMPVPGFRRLTLSQLITRKKYVKNLLRSCKSTIEALSLDCIAFTAHSDDRGIEDFLKEELNLKEVTLRCLNFALSGMCFGRVNQQRFYCRELRARSRLDNQTCQQLSRPI